MYIIETVLPLAISALAFVIAWKHNSFTQKAAEDPILVAHLSLDVDAPLFINFSISNVGAGVAKNIKFNAIRSNEQPEVKLKTPIFELDKKYSVLLEGKSLSLLLGYAPDLMDKDKGLFKFEVELEYENIKNKKIKNSYTLDVNEFEHTQIITSNISKIAEHLEKIAKNTAK